MNAILCFESWSQIIELIFDEGRWHPPKGDFIALYTRAMRCFIVSVRARVLSSLELEFIPQGGVKDAGVLELGSPPPPPEAHTPALFFRVSML